MKRITAYIANILTGAAMLCMAASCSMMEESTDYCPKGLYVRFVYDYNIQRADMLKDHVGYVRLFVYDTDGRKVAEKTVANTEGMSPLKDYGYSMHFMPGELRPGTYRLQAVAFQKDYYDAMTSKGAKYRFDEPQNSTDLKIALDHKADAMAGTELHEVVNEGAPMDTLWHTLKVMSHSPKDGVEVPRIHDTKAPYSVYPLDSQYVTVSDELATYATVSLIRDTKHLNLTLRQMDDPSDMLARDYAVTISDCNALLGHDNAPLPSDSLLYTPYASWTTRFDQDGLDVEKDDDRDHAWEDGVQRTAHYDLMFNRLTIDDKKPDEGARLKIRNKKTGALVADMNLTYILAQGRTAYELNHYSPQEYLDREYTYRLDFILKGDKWVACYVTIDVLSWNYRIQNEQI